MEKDLKQMTGEELNEKFIKFLTESTPEELANVIQKFEQEEPHKSSKILLIVKTVAFRGLLQQLNIPSYTLQRIRGCKTHLHVNTETNQSSLFITKKDRENFHLVYPKIYDQHKDELLQMIETRSTVPPEKEVV